MSFEYQKSGKIAEIIINRPQKRNAINFEMWLDLPKMLEDANKDNSVKILRLQSSEMGIFSSGADLSEMLENINDKSWLKENQRRINAAQFALTRFAKPALAQIDGDCIGAGMGLALACDFRIATNSSRFGIPPAKLGLIYPLHDTKLLVDLIGPSKAKFLLYTGEMLDAVRAYEIGLIDEINENSNALCEKLCERSSYSQIYAKQNIRAILEGQAFDNDASLESFLKSFENEDFKEGVSAFLEKRKPNFK